MTANNDRAGALLALSLLVLALGGMLGLAAAPYLRLAALEEETGEKRQLLKALEAQMARQAAGGGSDPAALLLRGETAGIAGAALQRLVNDRVGEAGGEASSFQLLPPRETGGTIRLALGFAMRIDVGGLRDLLHAIETGEPLLFVDDIAIRRLEKGMSEGDGSGPLDVTMQVSSFLPKGGGR